MAIKYLSIGVEIHGIEIKDDAALGFLTGWIKTATYAALMGNMKDLYNFRNEFDDDIKVEIEEQAGTIEV